MVHVLLMEKLSLLLYQIPNNMSSNQKIEHPGIIERIENDCVFVKITSQSACASCHAKGMCNMTEMEDKIIEVIKEKNKAYSIGQEVTVVLEPSLGTKAVILGYFLPFLILLLTLIIALQILSNEWQAGLLALFVLIPYYAVLYFNKDRLKKTFTFNIK